jgi:hypothetical protein
VCVCGQTALTSGADAKQTTPFASNHTEFEHIVDAVTGLTTGVRLRPRHCRSRKNDAAKGRTLSGERRQRCGLIRSTRPKSSLTHTEPKPTPSRTGRPTICSLATSRPVCRST